MKELHEAKLREGSARSESWTLIINAEKRLDEGNTTLMEVQNDKARRQKEDPTRAGFLDPAIARLENIVAVSKMKLDTIDKSAAFRQFAERGTLATKDIASAENTLATTRRNIVRAAWYLWAFIFGAIGAATLIIFNRFVVHRPADEDPLAVLWLTFAGGVIGLMVVSYAGDKWGFFKDTGDTVDARIGLIIGIAIGAGLAWDVVVHGTRFMFRRYFKTLTPATELSGAAPTT